MGGETESTTITIKYRQYIASEPLWFRRYFFAWKVAKETAREAGKKAAKETAKAAAKMLSLNIVNLLFLILGIVFHRTPIGYVRAITRAASGVGGIILQFPFYAGIQGIMTTAGAGGVSLAGAISEAFVSISTPRTFPALCYLAAGVVNFFVPSGGGQWAVQGPIMMPASLALGVEPAVTAMAIAWGDAWTNMLQPFWALPALAIAGLGARDIMGYCAIVLMVAGAVTALGFLFLVPVLA